MTRIPDNGDPPFHQGQPDPTPRSEPGDDLHEMRESLLEAQEMALLGTLRVDMRSGALICSRSLKKLFALDPEAEIDFSGYTSRILPEDRPQVDRIRKAAWESDTDNYRFECRFRRFDGVVRYFRVWVRIVRDQEGGPQRLLGTFQDTTEQVMLRKELEASQARYRDYMEHAPTGVLVVDGQGRFVECNRAASIITGYSREELLAMTVSELYPQKDGQLVYRHYREICLQGRFAAERSFLRKGGTLAYWQVQGVALPDGHFLGLLQDLTEQQKAREKARESEERYQTLFQTIMEGFAIHEAVLDREGNLVDYVFVDINPAFDGLTGLRGEAIRGRTAREVLGAGLEDHWLEAYGKVITRGESLRFRAFAASLGRWYEVLAFPISPRRFGTLFRDVTDAQRQEEQLRQSHVRLQRHVEELNEAWSQTIRVLADVVEFRDPYTSGHQRRVAGIAGALCREMGLDEEMTYETVQAAIVHDVGKIQVPSDFLSKPGRLHAREYEIIKKHPQVAADLLSGIDLPWPLAQIVGQHHERLDGSGYPQGLKGDEILLQARIIAVADVVEAMASHRPYRPALGIDVALEEIRRGAGSLYDRDVVTACETLFCKKGYSIAEVGYSG